MQNKIQSFITTKSTCDIASASILIKYVSCDFKIPSAINILSVIHPSRKPKTNLSGEAAYKSFTPSPLPPNPPVELDVLIHYQFETIHPFLDGNGRIGRLLIILYLMKKQVLITPALYISYFLKKNRIEYYDCMSEVRRNGNYEQYSTLCRGICNAGESALP